MNTFIMGPTASVIVEIKAYKPSFLPANFMIRVTRRTLMILASCGAADKVFIIAPGTNPMPMSNKLAQQTKKSNLFHAVLK